jgi:hypothetical protein
MHHLLSYYQVQKRYIDHIFLVTSLSRLIHVTLRQKRPVNRLLCYPHHIIQTILEKRLGMWQTLPGAGVLAVRGGCILMVLHYRGGKYRWELPSGYVNKGESMEQAAIRDTGRNGGFCVYRLVALYRCDGCAT